MTTQFITREIDSLIGDIWNASESEIDYFDCVCALESLRGKDIMIPAGRRERSSAWSSSSWSSTGFSAGPTEARRALS